VRLGENAIFRLPHGIIARVSRPGRQHSARREVALSRWLNVSGVAAVAALADLDQPVEIGERSITFWEELPAHRQGSPVEVADLLRRLHALPIPNDPPLDGLDPFVRLPERIDSAVTVPDDDRAWLRARVAELHDQWAGLVPGLPTCVVHGDAWAGNVVATDNGRVVLLDLERCSVGPPEWDLASTAVKYITYGLIGRAEYQPFCDAYGFDVTMLNGFAVIRDIRAALGLAEGLETAEEQETSRVAQGPPEGGGLTGGCLDFARSPSNFRTVPGPATSQCAKLLR
jgi:hypothetical protein